jgi:uncharacterized PurR-regulated membrane protein YhhQ (DUF165 family)
VSFKLCKNHYWKSTPKKWRKVGDSILAIGTFLATGGLMGMDSLKELYTTEEIRLFVAVSMGLGVVGKFLTNFFKEDNDKEASE